MSDLVRNPKDPFSHNEAHIIPDQLEKSITLTIKRCLMHVDVFAFVPVIIEISQLMKL